MALVYAENVVRKTNRPVLLATPLAVGAQFLAEAEKFGVAAKRTRDGHITSEKCVWITNYEQLHKYDPSQFSGFIGDEFSCVKDMKSQTKATVMEFCREMPYRLGDTATAAPNDYHELGNSSEILGYLGFRDMITRFFKQETSKDHLGWGRTKYHFRGHAEQPFWAWVCSWATSLRKPSDIGFSDDKFQLPPLIQKEIVVENQVVKKGRLFPVAASNMREQKAERRATIKERCEMAAQIAIGCDGPTTLWCELNPEGDLLEKLIPDCVQVSGSMKDEAKEEALTAFTNGQIKRIVLKPRIAGKGLNWQHCANAVELPSYSWENHYQLVRRHYRFGQLNTVTVTLIVSESERGILRSLERKQRQSDRMFNSIVNHMNDPMHLVSADKYTLKEEVPSWLSNGK